MSYRKCNHGHVNDFYDNINQISQIIAKYYNLDVEIMVKTQKRSGMARKYTYTNAKTMTAYFIREYMEDDATYEMIAEYFGTVHPTILKNIKVLKRNIDILPKLKLDETNIRKILKIKMNKECCIYKFK